MSLLGWFGRRLRFQLFLWTEWWRATVRTAPGEIAPRVYLPEQHRHSIKTVTTIGSYAGAALALFTLQRPVNLIVSAGLLVIERTLNRVIYRFQTLFVPRPMLRTLSDIGFDHLAVADVAHPPGHPPIVFLGFPTCDRATELFTVFAAWCAHPVRDTTVDDREPARIGLSIVFEDPQTYRVFVYRTLTPPVGRPDNVLGPEQVDELVQVSVIQTRLFPVVGTESAVHDAQRLLAGGQEYILAAARVENGQVIRCVGLPSFRKTGLRLRSRFQLNRAADPVEYVAYQIIELGRH